MKHLPKHFSVLYSLLQVQRSHGLKSTVSSRSEQASQPLYSLSQAVIRAFRPTPLEEATHKHSLSHLDL